MSFIQTEVPGAATGVAKARPGYIFLLTMVAALGGLLFGYDTAVVNGAEQSLTEFYIRGILDPSRYETLAVPMVGQYRLLLSGTLLVVALIISGQMIRLLQGARGWMASGVVLAILGIWGAGFLSRPVPSDPLALQNTADGIKGFLVSSALIGCVIGGAAGGFVSNYFGRKKGLLISAITFILSALGAWHPEQFNIFGIQDAYAFVIYRIVGGVGVGLASMISPMYIAEIAPAGSRGKLVSFNQFAIIFGMLVIYFVNYWISQQGDTEWLHTEGWRWMFFSGVVPAALFFVLLLFVPETPRYLAMKGRDAESLAVLRKISGGDAAPNILADIRKTTRESRAPWLSYGSLLIVVGVLLSVFQQVVGINVVLYYAGNIFRNMGASTDSSLLQTIIVGVVNLVFTVVAILTVDRFGRKPLMIIGSVGMAVSMLALGFAFYFNTLGLAALFCMLLYTAAFALSWGPVCWVLLAEIFPNSIRSALSVAVAAQWIANWLVSLTFPIMNDNQALTQKFNHGFAYWIYGVMAILSAVFVWRLVPETKGRSLEEIEDFWKAPGENA